MRKYFIVINNLPHNAYFFDEGEFRYSFTDQDSNNRHYQEYLAWVAEGNVAEEWNPEE